MTSSRLKNVRFAECCFVEPDQRAGRVGGFAGRVRSFIRGIRFSLATGLHVIAAHERRHLWQAWRVREAAERAVAA
jgi:hypothetical protein